MQTNRLKNFLLPVLALLCTVVSIICLKDYYACYSESRFRISYDIKFDQDLIGQLAIYYTDQNFKDYAFDEQHKLTDGFVGKKDEWQTVNFKYIGKKPLKIRHLRLGFGNTGNYDYIEIKNIRVNRVPISSYNFNLSFNTLHDLKLISNDNGILKLDRLGNNPFFDLKEELGATSHLRLSYTSLALVFIFSIFLLAFFYLLLNKILFGDGKVSDRIFISVVAITLLLPMVNIDYDSKASKEENRKFNTYKPLVNKDHGLNLQYGQNFEKWFNDRFNLRKQIISLHGKIINKVDRYFNFERVFKGDHNFLFYKGDHSIEYALGLVQKRLPEQLILSDYGTNFLNKISGDVYFMIAPAKATIYPENYLISKRNVVHKYSKEIIHKNKIIYIVNPVDELYAAKAQTELYFSHDTHWNAVGACIGANALFKVWGFDMVEDDCFNWKSNNQPRLGDLDNMLPYGIKRKINDYYLENVAFVKLYNQYVTCNKTTNAKTNCSSSYPTAKTKKLIVVCDSMILSAEIKMYIALAYKSTEFYYTNFDSSLKHIDHCNDCDYLIESTERTFDSSFYSHLSKLNKMLN